MRSAVLIVMAFLAAQWGGTGIGNRGRPVDQKIVGGSEVRDIREMPYIIAISQVERNCTAEDTGKKKCKDKWYFTCGGSLLNSHYVITACHCMVDFEGEDKAPIPMRGPNYTILRAADFRYVAGSRSIHPLDGTAQIRVPSELHHHPQCAQEDMTAVSDLGIAKMQKPFDINEFVQPVKLLSSDRQKFQTEFDLMLQHNPYCQVTGWGSTVRERIDLLTNEHITDGMKPPSLALIMKTAEMDVLTQGVCLKKFAEWAGEDFVPIELDFKKLDQICIWSPRGNEGFCSGDSGSPFVCNGYFIALVSTSFECGTSLPQVCQMVTSLLDWIRRDFCNKSDCSDMLYNLEPLKNGKQPTSPKQEKKHADAGARGIEVIAIVTVMVIHLLIN